MEETKRTAGNPLLEVAWEPCFVSPHRDAELEALARRKIGVVPTMISHTAPCPWIPRTFMAWSYEDGLLAGLDLDTADLIALVVSQENACRYCYAAVRALLRVRGWSEARVQALEERLAGLKLPPELAAAVTFARRLARASPLPEPADRQALAAAGWSPLQIRELVFVIAGTVFTNRISTMLALPPEEMEHLPERWLVKVLRPALGQWLERHRRPAPPVTAASPAALPAASPAAPSDTAYEWIPPLFDGSPIAAVLARTLDAALEAPMLAPRGRALMLAVIAHALGCARSAASARQLALGSGLRDGALMPILAHLDSPELTAEERRLLRLARESVWYTPVQIQRLARALHGELPPPMLLDAVGVAALGNALCRLGAAADG